LHHISQEREPWFGSLLFSDKLPDYLPTGGVGDGVGLGGVGDGVGLGVASVAGAVSVARVGVGVGVGVAAGGFTGATGRELGCGFEALMDGATSVPAARFTAARNFSADCGG